MSLLMRGTKIKRPEQTPKADARLFLWAAIL
jgi:hypothetical protein